VPAGSGVFAAGVAESVAVTSGVGIAASFTGVWLPEANGSAFWQPHVRHEAGITSAVAAINGTIFILAVTFAPPGGCCEENAMQMSIDRNA